MANWIIKGTSDEITTCARCGKSNLKKTIFMESDEGDMGFFGSECATTVQGAGRITSTNAKAEIMRKAEIVAMFHAERAKAIEGGCLPNRASVKAFENTARHFRIDAARRGIVKNDDGLPRIVFFGPGFGFAWFKFHVIKGQF